MPINSTRGAASAKAFGFTSGKKKWDKKVDYLIVAGGGGGGGMIAGGGGAGGYRSTFPTGGTFEVTATTYPIVIGGGGTGGGGVNAGGGAGNPSSALGLTATGGGG